MMKRKVANKFWENKKVLVAGGAGFSGSHVVEILVGLGSKVTVADNLENGKMSNLYAVRKNVVFLNKDLRTLDNCLKVTKGSQIVLNMAARVGGIKFNNTHQATMFRDNLFISTNMLEASRMNSVERFLAVSSACVYSSGVKIPTLESEGFLGIPEASNEGYGWAKRMSEYQAEAYAKEFDMKIAIARPSNTYGPRDHFDLETSHVIPALIKRIFLKEDPLVVWGSGEQTRSFIYVADFARGMVELIEKYPVADPVNIGSDEEVKIKDLVSILLELTGEKPFVVFDSDKPSGHLRRASDNSKAKEKIGFAAATGLRQGLQETINWYRKEYSI